MPSFSIPSSTIVIEAIVNIIIEARNLAAFVSGSITHRDAVYPGAAGSIPNCN
jgi:hypothetical protein